MSAHTSGPWIFYADLPSTEPNWHIVTPENKMRVLANVHIEPGNEMDLANARLIAAAPDLLEALILLEAEMVLSGNAGSTDYGWKPAIEKTRAAIEKATGAT